MMNKWVYLMVLVFSGSLPDGESCAELVFIKSQLNHEAKLVHAVVLFARIFYS